MFFLSLFAVMHRKARWSVSPFLTRSKSLNLQPYHFSSLSCVELLTTQYMKLLPSLQDTVKHTH